MRFAILAFLGLLEVKEAIFKGGGLEPIFLWQLMAYEINQREEVRVRPTASSLEPIASGKDQEVLTVGDQWLCHSPQTEFARTRCGVSQRE